MAQAGEAGAAVKRFKAAFSLGVFTCQHEFSDCVTAVNKGIGLMHRDGNALAVNAFLESH